MESSFIPPWNDFPDLTLLIRRTNSGDKEAENLLFRIGYSHLCRLASRLLGLENPRTRAEITPGDLLHDVYLGRIRKWNGPVTDRRHFTAVIAEAMRDELINRARRTGTIKRTMKHGFPERIVSSLPAEDLVSLNSELEHLRTYDPAAAEIVRLRYYGGCSWEETAVAAHVSVKVARTEWECAKKWLQAWLRS